MNESFFAVTTGGGGIWFTATETSLTSFRSRRNSSFWAPVTVLIRTMVPSSAPDSADTTEVLLSIDSPQLPEDLLRKLPVLMVVFAPLTGSTLISLGASPVAVRAHQDRAVPSHCDRIRTRPRSGTWSTRAGCRRLGRSGRPSARWRRRPLRRVRPRSLTPCRADRRRPARRRRGRLCASSGPRFFQSARSRMAIRSPSGPATMSLNSETPVEAVPDLGLFARERSSRTMSPSRLARRSRRSGRPPR